jgi:hypothetical protein
MRKLEIGLMIFGFLMAMHLEAQEIPSPQTKEDIVKLYSVQFDYIATTFTAYLSDLAKQNGDVVVSNYKGRSSFTSALNPKPLAIRMKSNAAWYFKILTHVELYQDALAITDGSQSEIALFAIDPKNKQFVTTVMVMEDGQKHTYSNACAVEDYQPVVNKALHFLIEDKIEHNSIIDYLESPPLPHGRLF